MRILMLSQFYPPIIGGEERATRDICVGLADRGHTVSMVTLAQPNAPDFEVLDGVRIHRLPALLQRLPFLYTNKALTHAPPFPDPSTARALRRILAEEDPRIVHATTWLSYAYLPFKRKNGPKFVVALHDQSLSCPKKKLIRGDGVCAGPSMQCFGCASQHYGLVKGVATTVLHRIASDIEVRLVDRFLPVSEATAHDNQLAERGLPYTVVPPPLPEDDGSADPAPYLAQLPEEPFFMFAGAFARHKGVDVLIDAYRRLENAPPLVVIGYDTTEYVLGSDAMPPNAHLFKNWPHAAVLAAWGRSLAAVMPSTWSEPFALVSVEAMAAGSPVIASNIGGMANNIQEGICGMLVPPRDPQALADAMARIAADPHLREWLSIGAVRRAEDFRRSAVIRQYEDVYAELIGEPVATAAEPALAA